MGLEPKIIVYTGCMFSAKTSSMVLDYERLTRGRFNMAAYNHWIDSERKKANTVYGNPEVGDIVTHSGAIIPAQYLGSRKLRELGQLESSLLLTDVRARITELEKIGTTLDAVFLNEAQFCDSKISEVLRYLRDSFGIYCVVSTLDQDFRKNPFPCWDDPSKNIGSLLCTADKVLKTKATCTHPEEGDRVCGRKASTTMRIVSDHRTELEGGSDKYIAACHKHHRIPE